MWAQQKMFSPLNQFSRKEKERKTPKGGKFDPQAK